MNVSNCLQMLTCYQAHGLLVSSKAFNFIKHYLSFLVTHCNIYARISHANHVNRYHRDTLDTLFLQKLDLAFDFVKQADGSI